MRVDKLTSAGVEVVLSERNLRSLLAKLDGHPPGSACMLEYDSRLGGGYVHLVVGAEPDEVHYANAERDFPAGTMHPETEDAVLLAEAISERDAANLAYDLCSAELAAERILADAVAGQAVRARRQRDLALLIGAAAIVLLWITLVVG